MKSPGQRRGEASKRHPGLPHTRTENPNGVLQTASTASADLGVVSGYETYHFHGGWLVYIENVLFWNPRRHNRLRHEGRNFRRQKEPPFRPSQNRHSQSWSCSAARREPTHARLWNSFRAFVSYSRNGQQKRLAAYQRAYRVMDLIGKVANVFRRKRTPTAAHRPVKIEMLRTSTRPVPDKATYWTLTIDDQSQIHAQRAWAIVLANRIAHVRSQACDWLPSVGEWHQQQSRLLLDVSVALSKEATSSHRVYRSYLLDD